MNAIKAKRKKNRDHARPKSKNSGSANRPKNNGSSSRPKKQSSIVDTNQLIKRATSTEEVVYEANRSFEDMPIDGKLKRNLAKKGFVKPSQIQDESLDLLKSGRNLIGIANTGTGKTAAFLIPIIERLLKQRELQTALVVVPTRELALQVEKEFVNCHSFKQKLSKSNDFPVAVEVRTHKPNIESPNSLKADVC